MMRWIRRTALLAALAAVSPSIRADEPISLKSGDHIAIVGNTLAERLQHDGWLETLIQSRYPGKDLTIRNLAFSGDELAVRLRSDGFGSPDDHLTRNKADVVFAFFGFNESFAGKAGLEKFEQELDSYLKHLKETKFNGKSAPSVVLFSPIAAENLHNKDLPDGAATNERIALYTKAMAEIAKKNGVTFVDLFEPSKQLEAAAKEPLTINGIHLNDEGNRQLAEVIDRSLFGARPEVIDYSKLQPLRNAVQDKNFHWFHRYRTTDGYSTYGGRADLAFTDGQTNRVVMDRELEVLDAMTANRDKRIWSLSQGKDLKVDDSNTPKFLEVKTNKPGSGPNGKHLFLGGSEAISKMTVDKRLKVNLFASEAEFPELINPVQMAFDTKGRLWVATWPSYPHWKPKDEMNDRLVILEDTDGDGKADKCKTFAGGLHNPTGFEFYNGGVLVANAPDILFLKDVDGDDRADIRERILHGIDSADTHHASNSFTMDPGGGLYFQEGVFHRTQVETPYGVVKNINAGVWRLEPHTGTFGTGKLERYVPFDFANPHGHVFNNWGQDFVVDGTGANPYHAALFSGYLTSPAKHSGPPQLYQQRTRPCSAVEIVSSRHFPDDMQGDLLVGNVIGFAGILRYHIKEKGASYEGIEAEPLLFSSDPNFRPADIKVGADGAIYFSDWHNPIIGHMQHNLRDPNRNHTYGRVYRVVAEGRPLLKPEPVAGEPIASLLERLKAPEERVRYRARIELSGRKTEEVIPQVKAWLAKLDPADANIEHHRMEGLWVHQFHNVVDEALLKQMLKSPVHRARAAATRVLCYWRDRVKEPLALIRVQAQDPHPAVRLEAVRACSFFPESEAADVALEIVKQPLDPYLSYTLKETMRQLEPQWKSALVEGKPLAANNPAGVDYLLQSVNSAELVKMPRTPTVLAALLTRPQIPPQFRREALQAMAAANKTTPVTELVSTIEQLDKLESGSSEQALRDLASLLFEDLSGDQAGHDHHAGHGSGGSGLAAVRERLAKLATNGRQGFTREVALAAWMTADQSIKAAFEAAGASSRSLHDWLGGIRLVPDAKLRATAYQALVPLASDNLVGWPAAVAKELDGRKGGTQGRYVRIELPRRGTLTLAEVQVMADGKNIAPTGKASQSSESNGGAAAKAIDGNTAGSYQGGGQTHTQENQENPWWELDLGSEQPIDSIVVWNRTDAELGKRLDGFKVSILDQNHKPVVVKDGIPAPAESVALALEADPAGSIRRAAFEALVSSGAEPQKVFSLLAERAKAGKLRDAALRALGRIPADQWPRGELRPLIDSIIEDVSKRAADQRTSPAVRDNLQLADELTNRLPSEEASNLRKTLRTLGVPVILIRPVPHLIIFDRTQIYVEAGKPFELVFENVDIMPHNLVIARQGQLAKVGVAGEAMAADPNAYAKNFVPTLPEVLQATKLLQPGQVERILITAPSEAGDYPYVCTFPGHWTRMNGVMHVVPDLDAVPREALLAASAPSAETPGATRAFVKAWTVADLAGDLNRLDLGRNTERGKAIFQSLACVQCHKVGGEGNGEVGPDMVELRKKLEAGKADPAYVLTSMIEPSKNIDEKYQTLILALTSGETVTGVAVAKDDKKLRISSNPLAPGGAVSRDIPVGEIEEQLISKISAMPEGLLNTLDKEEILDLLGYILSDGK